MRTSCLTFILLLPLLLLLLFFCGFIEDLFLIKTHSFNNGGIGFIQFFFFGTVLLKIVVLLFSNEFCLRILFDG